MVAFITVCVIGVAGVLGALLYGRRRPVGASMTWGQAMLAATFVFFMFWWWYGVIPHWWLTWADSELGWSDDNIWLEPSSWQPLTISFQVIRDFVVLVIYGVGIGLHVAAWAVWQGRAKQRKAPPVPASRYGRPLVKQG